MALRISTKLFLIILIFSSSLWGKTTLPELLTKQAVSNIRYLSADGKFTYYQKRSGSLLLSSNYRVIELIKGEPGSEYNVIATSSHKKIAVSQNPYFHNFYSLRAKESIYVGNYGEPLLKKIGDGKKPQLHLNDNWISFYDPYEKVILFQNTVNDVLKFSIKLNNRISPYFIPNVTMSDEDTIFYTDLSENGAPGLLMYKRSITKSELIFKSDSPMNRAEICLHQNQIVFALFGIHGAKHGTSFSISPLPISDFSKREVIYKSDLNDLGNLNCNIDTSSIAFVKNHGSLELPEYDIYLLNTLSKQLTALSDQQMLTSFVNMDGILLTQDRGKYYIVKGENDFKSIDSFKPKNTVEEKKTTKEEMTNE